MGKCFVEPKVKDSFFVNIAGREYEIPYDDWYITKVLNLAIQFKHTSGAQCTLYPKLGLRISMSPAFRE